MRRLLLAMLFLTFAAAADAATTYRVRFTSTDFQWMFSAATVTVDGANVYARMERRSGTPATYDAIFSTDGGRTLTALNHELQTWFPLKRSPLVVESRLFAPPPMNAKAGKRARNVEWSPLNANATADAPAGGRLSFVVDYNFAGTRVRTNYFATVEVWFDGSRPAALWPATVPLITGFEAADAEIARQSVLTALPRRMVVTITRQYAGGPSVSETRTFQVEDVAEAPPIAPSLLRVPPNYVEQPPIVSGPGVTRQP